MCFQVVDKHSDITPQQIFHFPHGLYGFEELHNFALTDSEYPPFYWLRSIEQHVGINFLLLSPDFLIANYSMEKAAAEDFGNIELTGHKDPNLLVFVIVTLNQNDLRALTANMRGPIIFNKKLQLGNQVIVHDERWSVCHCLHEFKHQKV